MIGALAMLQADQLPFGWAQLAMFGPTVVILILILGFLLKIAPTWKDIKSRELGVREEEAKARGQQASALLAIGGALQGLGKSITLSTEVMEKVAVDQRRVADATRITQGVYEDTTHELVETTNALVATVRELSGRMVTLEGHFGTERGDRITHAS